MSETKIGRREFLTSVSVVGAASASVQALGPAAVEAQTVSQAAAPAEAAGYQYLKPVEQAFVEALVDHMIPKDELTGSGTEIGIATYIDRALAGSWGKGDRLYMQGPWQRGTPNQGYQLPLAPAELYPPTAIAARSSARLSPAAPPTRRRRSSMTSPPARSRLPATYRAAPSSRCCTRT